MSDIYQTSDVLVVPSIIAQNGDREGLPNVCIEAMSYGLPIIASRVAGLPEVVIDGVNGRLVPPGDSRALSHAMIEFLNTKNNSTNILKVNQLLVQQKFDIGKNVALLKKIMLVHSKSKVSTSIETTNLGQVNFEKNYYSGYLSSRKY